ncbi:MAG TPA: hypothetical protein VFK79_07375 [Xanthobacteraceae bacterium]|nr:hypothetical protein [Xanthobacteraceae bacterium]
MPAPALFFGLNFESWLWVFITILGTVAAVVVARQKRRRWAELGDEEEPVLQGEVQRDHWHDAGGDSHPPR